MKMAFKIARTSLILIFSGLIWSCTPKAVTRISASFPPLDYQEKVYVIGPSDPQPPFAREIGTLKARLNPYRGMGKWKDAVAETAFEARKVGGDAIQITKYTLANAWQSEQIEARILKVETSAGRRYLEERLNVFSDSTWDYAKLYVYRHPHLNPLSKYNLYLNDSLLCEVKSGFAQEFILLKEGMYLLWAGSLAGDRSEVPVHVKFGKTYYLSCSWGNSYLDLSLADELQGELQYNAILNR